MNNFRNVSLQAHKGVSTECPENTMSAFRCAAAQDYDIIELDLEYTSDKKIVVLHDTLINRTARNTDGSPLPEPVCIHDVKYAEAAAYDFGIGFSNKFAGEKIPLFEDVLLFAKESGIRLKIDNKIQAFPKDILEGLFEMIKPYTDIASVTSNSIDFVRNCLEKLPDISIDYDGNVTEEILRSLRAILPPERLTVWLPYKCAATSWVKTPFADAELCSLVKKYSRLGIWILSDEEDFADAVNVLGADVVETNGSLKPYRRAGERYDMHTHSENSHDSKCPVRDMVQSAKNHGLSAFAVTDHCDIEYCDSIDIDKLIEDSHRDAAETEKITGIPVLKGAEFGEMIMYPDKTKSLMKEHEYDVIIGSVHMVLIDGVDIPYAQVDFSKFDDKTLHTFLERYFDDMLRTVREHSFDILAHLTCPLRYINGKYNRGVSLEPYMDKIKTILSEIIKRGIALEVNTSCAYDGSGYPEFMPNESIIRLYRSMGGYLVTTASDAHIAENCANSFDSLYNLLREIGFKNIYYYKNRCAVQCALN